MSELVGSGADADVRVVAAQLGRAPRRPWGIACTCGFGFPTVLWVGPVLEDGTPFPTYYWLSCPWLVEAVSRVESEGGVAEWARRLSDDEKLASRMRAAEEEYRSARESEGVAVPGGSQGFAGQRDVLATKCLHAHAAAWLAGIDDPVGEGVVQATGRECEDGRCGALLEPTAGEADE